MAVATVTPDKARVLFQKINLATNISNANIIMLMSGTQVKPWR
jgi:hypothetical protein